jgi:hypothetical protein
MVVSVMFNQDRTSHGEVAVSIRKLPEDVKMVMKRFNYLDTEGSLQIQITGNRFVRRGRELLGLRSNVLSAVYLEDIRGTISPVQGKGILEFSAEEAEWDSDPSKPLILQRKANVTINKRRLEGVKNARLYLRRGILVTTGKHREVFQLRELLSK